MKIFSYSLLFTVSAGLFLGSCSKSTDPDPNPTNSNVLKGTISSDRILINGADAIDYYLEDVVSVEAKLTIEPGTVIAAKAGSGISFSTAKGVVVAKGTMEKPIVFRSESGAKGGWLGMKFNDSNNPLNELTYVTITDGGSTSFDGNEKSKGNLQFSGTNQIKMNKCIVSNSANWGIYETFSSDLTLVEFDSNRFNNNTNFPIYVFDQTVKDLGSSSFFTGNTRNFIGLLQKSFLGLPGAHSWKKQGVPYFWDDTDRLVIGYNTTNGSLILEAGLTLVMGPGTGIVVGDNSNNTASLQLSGTSTNPVIVRGESPVKGFWKGILIGTGSALNDFSFATISDGGSVNLSNGVSKANVVIDSDSNLKMSNTTLSNSAGCGSTKAEDATVTGSGNVYNNNTTGTNCTF